MRSAILITSNVFIHFIRQTGAEEISLTSAPYKAKTTPLKTSVDIPVEQLIGNKRAAWSTQNTDLDKTMLGKSRMCAHLQNHGTMQTRRLVPHTELLHSVSRIGPAMACNPMFHSTSISRNALFKRDSLRPVWGTIAANCRIHSLIARASKRHVHRTRCHSVKSSATGNCTSEFDWPIAGVTVSPNGFRVALTSEDRSRCAPLVVSPRDTEVLQSSEALTLMQLMAGIDSATAIFPPNALAQAFDADDGNVTLTEVRITPTVTDQGTDDYASEAFGTKIETTVGEPSAEALAEKVPKLIVASRSFVFPGSPALSIEQSTNLLKRYGDANAELSKDSFSIIVAALRTGTVGDLLEPDRAKARVMEMAKTKWELVAEGGVAVKVAPFTALACAARYRVPLAVPPELFAEEAGLSLSPAELLEVYPKFRTMSMLKEEFPQAGSLSSMFVKAKY